jgi:hypothetical protein
MGMGIFFELIISNIMNNLDIATCHLMDDYLVVMCHECIYRFRGFLVLQRVNVIFDN